MSEEGSDQEAEAIGDEDGVRFIWPLGRDIAKPHTLAEAAHLIGLWAEKYPDYVIDFAEYDGDGIILDFLNPEAVL